MSYDFIVRKGVNGYYLEFEDGNKVSWDEVRPLLDTKNGEKSESDRFIMYSIKGTDKRGNPCAYNLRVGNEHINSYKEFIEDVELRCFKEEKSSIFKNVNLKKINWKRLAIIGLSIVLVASTPAVIKATKEAINEDNEDWINRNSAPSYAYDNPSFNPELDEYNEYIKSIQKEEALTEKCNILLTRALNGDSEALKDLREQALSNNDAAQDALSTYLDQTSENFKDKTR